MKILVVGSTGALGRHVVPRLVERGHKVKAIIRRPESAPFIEQVGAEPVLGDIFDRGSLDGAARGCEAAMHLATAIPKDPNQGWALNDRIRREGTRSFLAAATANGLRRYVQQSIALVYGEHGQEIVDESVPHQIDPINHSASDMEALVRESRLEWCILRGGFFYGTGTGREESWRQAAREGRLELPGEGDDLVSLVNVVDMARAAAIAVEGAPAGSVYNIVDDEPVSYKRLFAYIAVQQSAPAPKAGGPKFLPSLGCSNAKAKRELDWAPVFPTFRSGLAQRA